MRKRVKPSVNCTLIKRSHYLELCMPTFGVYAKNGSTKTILDHLRLIHGIGIGNNAALFNDPSQKNCLEVFQDEVH